MIGKNVYLRALEPEDLPLLYEWENDESVWKVSNTLAPYSKAVLKNFIETSGNDIFSAKQLRLMVAEKSTRRTVGIADIFEFAPEHSRAGIGILIEKQSRGKGYGYESIILLQKYLFEVLRVHQIFCNVLIDNNISMHLFKKAGFEVVGVKKEWIQTAEGYVDEVLLQCINKLTVK